MSGYESGLVDPNLTNMEYSMKKALEVARMEFESIVSQSNKPVLVDFYAPWCAPCQVLGPTVDEIATSFDGRVDVLKVNVDQEVELSCRYNIQSLPTLVFLRGGREVKRVTGAIPKGAFKSTLEGLLEGNKTAT